MLGFKSLGGPCLDECHWVLLSLAQNVVQLVRWRCCWDELATCVKVAVVKLCGRNFQDAACVAMLLAPFGQSRGFPALALTLAVHAVVVHGCQQTPLLQQEPNPFQRGGG